MHLTTYVIFNALQSLAKDEKLAYVPSPGRVPAAKLLHVEESALHGRGQSGRRLRVRDEAKGKYSFSDNQPPFELRFRTRYSQWRRR